MSSMSLSSTMNPWKEHMIRHSYRQKMRMERQRRRFKTHLELTTVSLLARREQWHISAGAMPRGSLLLVIPKDNPRLRACLLGAGRAHARRGKKVVIRYAPSGR